MRVSALLAVICSCVALSAVASATTVAQSACPPEAARTRAIVARFLTEENWAASRQENAITVASSSVVLLTDAADAPVCQKLRAMVEPVNNRYPQIFSYYKAGGFYFIVSRSTVPSGRIWTGFSPLLVLRSDFTVVNSFAM